MQDILLERQFDPVLTEDSFMEMAREGADCMPLYRINWAESLMSARGDRLVGRFEAPDTEAVRRLAASSQPRNSSAWSGTVHDTGRDGEPTVVVERGFDDAVTLDELQAREDAAAWCLEQHRVTFLRTFFSLDRRRMICLYRAPDAESVRLAQAEAKMPVERVWACRRYAMANFS
jgi:hypothetical protein